MDVTTSTLTEANSPYTIYAKHTVGADSTCSTASVSYTYDGTAPSFSSAAYSGSMIAVTMSESVYASTSPVATDFNVTVGGSAGTISLVTVQNTVNLASNTILLFLSSSITSGSAVKVWYTKGTNTVTDLAGNVLESLAQGSALTASEQKSITISDVADDNSINATEDDSAVLIAGTSTGLTTGTQVTIDIDDDDPGSIANESFTVSTDSSGAWTTASTDLTSTKVQNLSEGTLTVSVSATGVTAVTKTVTYDRTTPTVTASVGGTDTNRTVSASDNDSGTTTMKYKVITSGTTCGATAMSSGTTSYTESASVTIGAEHNGSKVCFSSADAAGNTGYAATSALTITLGILAAPTVVFSPVNGGYAAGNVNVTIDFDESIYSDSTCNTSLNNTTAESITDLREVNSGGTAIAHVATYDAATHTITLNPDSDISNNVVVYVGLTNAWYYDESGTCTRGNAGTVSFTVDAAAPSAPTGLDLAADDDTGLSNTDNVTKNTTGLDISGCAEADSTVEIFKDGASFSTPVTDVADTTDTACTGGTKKFSASISLGASAAAYSITAKATDSANNTSAASTALSITVDGTVPTVTTIEYEDSADGDRADRHECGADRLFLYYCLIFRECCTNAGGRLNRSAGHFL